MKIQITPEIIVRSFILTDAQEIANNANNLKVWEQLRDVFPHPYTEKDAKSFISFCQSQQPEINFAIVYKNEACGAIGLKLNSDIERFSAEIGYWIGERFWGKGIVSSVLKGFSEYAFEAYKLNRLYALPFSENRASNRVLEKAGYTLEGRLKKSAFKNGQYKDQLMYALVT